MFHTYWVFSAFMSTVDVSYQTVYLDLITLDWKFGTLHVLGRRRYKQQRFNQFSSKMTALI